MVSIIQSKHRRRVAENRWNGVGVPELSEAVNAYHNVTTSKEFEEIERLRIKAGHNEASALRNARRKVEEKYKPIVEKQAAELEKQAAENKKQAEEIKKLKAELEKLTES